MPMRTSHPLLLVSTLLLAMPLAGCVSSASQCTSAECQADAKITAGVHEKLKAHRELGPPNLVYVQTRRGVVYLTGQVATDLQRETAETIAGHVPGVVNVVNSIALSYSGR
jgi:osmotically-inducible protein OsmY